MSIQRKKKYPLNHAIDTKAPITTQPEHTMPSDINLSDAISEIKDALTNAFGVSTESSSESDENELASYINNMGITNTLVYEGPRLRDAEEGETPTHFNKGLKAWED